ncbi:MAG: DUF4402 domain-containing protein [Micavibrio sp.]|nr:MAG: DUF4402 domain-containing protein [Micavibrio sp.]
MSFNKFFKTATMCAAVGLVALPLVAKAADDVIHASVQFLTVIEIDVVDDMEFGIVEFSGPPTGAGDFVSLGTDGVLAYNGVFSGSGAGGVPARVEVTVGTSGETVQVQCSNSAVLADMTDSSSTIAIDAVQVTHSLSPTAFATGSCDGIGTSALTYELGSTAEDAFLFGGRITGVGASNFGEGNYSTNTAGGVPIDVTIVYN